MALHAKLAHAYDRGNYCNAYETQDWETAWANNCEELKDVETGFMLGFFSSYEIHEIPEDLQEHVEYSRKALGVDND